MMETKDCECGKKMILVGTGIVLTSIPLQYPQEWWCGGCKRKEDGTTIIEKTFEQIIMDRWEQANLKPDFECPKHTDPRKGKDAFMSVLYQDLKYTICMVCLAELLHKKEDEVHTLLEKLELAKE